MKIKKILIIVDYRQQFYSSIKISSGGMNLDLIFKYFTNSEYNVEIINFADINKINDFKNTFILYQSSEDKDLFYKNFISDVMRHIENLGALLIPKYDYFHAHENKVYQSLLTKDINIENLYIPKSCIFGSYEEFQSFKLLNMVFPVVLKSSDGCQSKGVSLCLNYNDLNKQIKNISSTFNFKDYIRFKLKKLLKKDYVIESLNLKKFLIQEFISNLNGDYKVLIYMDKAFVLKRHNRKNDFRASGSGIFEFVEDLPKGLLEVAYELRNYFDVPFISIDIAFNESMQSFILIEIQFMMFGTYTLEKSPHYYVKDDKDIRIIKTSSNLEKVFCESIISYIEDIK